MTGSARQTKAAMDPLEERKPIHYALGDVGKPEDMVDHANNNLMAVASLKPNDPCFVLRSGGRFTFAKLLSRQHGPESHMELQVDVIGSTKVIPMNHCARYIRPLQLMQQQKPSPPQPQRRLRVAQRRSSETLPQKCTAKRPGLDRQSKSMHANLPSGQRRASFQSAPNDTKLMPARGSGRRASLHASFQCGLHDSAKRRPSRSSCRASPRSSIMTHVPEDNELPSDVALNSTEVIKFDSEINSESYADDEDGLCSSSPDEESPCSTTPQDLVIKNNNHSLKRVPLPRGFDDLEFNEESLLTAFRSDEGSPCSTTPQDLVMKNNNCYKNCSLKGVPLPRGFDDLEFNEESLLAAFRSIGPRTA